jgi:hypothetical protein
MEPVREGIFTKLNVLIAVIALAVMWYYSSRTFIAVSPSPLASSPASVATPEPSPSVQTAPPPIHTAPPPKVAPVEQPETAVSDRSTSSFSVEPPSQGPEREQAKPAAPEILRQRVSDHIFELKQCSLSGTSLECEVLITNQGEDRTLRLSPGSARLVDEGGTEYSCISLTLGGGGSHVPTMTFGDNKPPAAAQLTNGVPIKAVLTFEGIPAGTKRAALIEIQEPAGGFYGGRGLKAQFRNVPLEQH